MADGKVWIKIDADDKGFADKLQNVDTSASKLASGALKTVGKATVAVGTSFTASAAAAIAAGSAYEETFAKTATIMDANVMSTEAMSVAIIDLSNDTGAAARELSNSVYDAISATGDTAHAVELVADASKLAVAGFADQGDALSVLTTITNAYKMETSEAQAISDSLIQTQNLGVTTVGQLASSMGKAIATASAYSIDLYNLESAYVSLTKAGISTEESTTYLSSMFDELGDSGSEVASIIKNKTGKSFGQLMQSGYSLGDVLEILLDSVNGDTEALANLWGSAEAGKASLAIAGQGIDTFNSNLDSLKNSAGTTEAAYETMTQTLSFQTDLLKTRITNLGTAVYDYFDDSLISGVSGLSDAFLMLSDSVTDGELSDEMAQIGAGVESLISSGVELASDVLPGIIDGAAWIVDNGGTIVTIIGSVAAAYGAYQSAATAATIAQKGLNSVIRLDPYGAAAAGIILVGTALYGLFNEANAADPEIRALNNSLEEGAEVTAALAENIDAVKNEYADYRGEVEENSKSNNELIASVIKLAASYDGSVSSAQEIQRIVEQLNAAIPELNLSFDEQTGILSKTSEEMKALNAEYEAQEKYDAALEYRTEMETARSEAVADLTEKKKTLANATEKLTEYEKQYMDSLGNISGPIDDYVFLQDAVEDASTAVADAKKNVEASETALSSAEAEVENCANELDSAAAAADAFTASTDNTTGAAKTEAAAVAEATKAIAQIGQDAYAAIQSGENLRDTYDDLRGQLDELTGSGDAYIESLAEQNLHILEVAATNQELAASYGNLVSYTGVSLTSLSSFLVANGVTADDWGSRVNSAIDSVMNGFTVLDTSLDMNLSTMAANLQSNIEAHVNWNANLQTLMAAAVATGDQSAIDFVMYMQSMGIGAADQVQSMVDNIDYTMSTFPPLFAEAANSGVVEVYNEIAGGTIAAGEASELMMDGAVTAIADAEPNATDATAEVVGSVVSSIEDATSDAEAAAERLGDAIVDGVKAGAKGMREAGTAAADKFLAGLKSGQNGIESAAGLLAKAGTTKINSGANDYRRAGTNAATNITSGLMSGKTGITTGTGTLATAITTRMGSSASSYRNAGYGAASTIASGISSGRSGIYSEAYSAASSGYYAVTALGWYSLGYNISAGIAYGVRGGSYLITAAARSAAYSALYSAKSALGVHSPSRVFQNEVGKMIPAGIALGIQDGEPEVVNALGKISDTMLAKTKAAVRPTVNTAATSYVTNNTINNHSSSGNRSLSIEVPLTIGRREVARATARYTGQELAYLLGVT